MQEPTKNVLTKRGKIFIYGYVPNRLASVSPGFRSAGLGKKTGIGIAYLCVQVIYRVGT
jgi:hypothetical protein